MNVSPLHDPILDRFRAAISRMYGPRLDRVVLFGSRARGDARPESDYDIAVFLMDMSDRWAELDRLARLSQQFQDDNAVVFDAKAYPAQAYDDDASPLMWDIRHDGRNL